MIVHNPPLDRHRDRLGKRTAEAIMAKDPVCGMQVDEATAAAKLDHHGKTYYFCSPVCKDTFEKNPEKYASGH
jgi:YHS domain-containing protein